MLTYEYSPLHDTIQTAEHSWVLLAREKGFQSRDGSLTIRPYNEPGIPDVDDTQLSLTSQLTSKAVSRHLGLRKVSRDGTEIEEMPWVAQLMLVRWQGNNAERVAIAYVNGTAWDAIVEKRGEKKAVRLT